jgi:ATP-dependent phosphofructokinase / diphosphate-dependent phosphofructokinase
MRIGILTGGGDVPGLNPCIKAVVNQAAADGPRGRRHPKRVGRAARVRPRRRGPSRAKWLPLTVTKVRTIDRAGGTYLHTSRTNPQKVRERPARFLAGSTRSTTGPYADCTAHVLEVLVASGSTRSSRSAATTRSRSLRLHEEGVPSSSIPKTMDNDVHGTDYCIGFSTAVTRSVEFIHALRTAGRQPRAASPWSSCSAATAARPR